MAHYGGGAADVGYRADLVVAGRRFDVFDAPTAGNRVTNLRDHTGTTTDAAITDAHGVLRFEAPDHAGDLFVIDAAAPAGAPRVRITPADLVPRLISAADAAASALAAAPAPGALSGLDERISQVETQAARVPGLDTRLGAAEQTLSGYAGLGSRLDTVENTTIPGLDARLGTLESAPAPSGGGADPELVARVEALEAAVAPVPSLGARLDGVEGVQGDLDSRISALESAPAPTGGGGAPAAPLAPALTNVTVDGNKATGELVRWDGGFPAALPLGSGVRFIVRLNLGNASSTTATYLGINITLGATQVGALGQNAVRIPNYTGGLRAATLVSMLDCVIIRSASGAVTGRIFAFSSVMTGAHYDITPRSGIIDMAGLTAIETTPLNLAVGAAWGPSSALSTNVVTSRESYLYRI